MYRLSVKVHSRGQGRRSMVKAAAYRAGGRLEDGGEVHDYSRKRGVVLAEIHAPQETPARLLERGELWREVERAEARVNSRLAREAVLAVPRGLTREQGVDLVRGWVSEQCVERGMIADVAWHRVRARDGGENFHAHVLTTTREVTAEGFGRKVREWDSKAVLREWRSSWEDHTNWHLERAGRAERVDQRSLVARRTEALERGDFARVAELDRERLPRLERDGRPSERDRAVLARNQAREQLYARIDCEERLFSHPMWMAMERTHYMQASKRPSPTP